MAMPARQQQCPMRWENRISCQLPLGHAGAHTNTAGQCWWGQVLLPPVPGSPADNAKNRIAGARSADPEVKPIRPDWADETNSILWAALGDAFTISPNSAPPPAPMGYGYGAPPPAPMRYGYGAPPPAPMRYGYGAPPPAPKRYQKRATNRQGSAQVVWLLCTLILFLVGAWFLGGWIAMTTFYLWLFGAWIISIAFG
jgi:hypothetical protein